MGDAVRRREQIWNKYKNNSNFRMYDVYHWEAHPDNVHPEPTTLEQRISHYEDYLEQFPSVVWPGLVQEVSNPLSDMFGLFKNYYGDQTYLLVIDTEGKIAYQNSFPKGSNNISNVYNDIDNLLPSIVPETALKENAKATPNNSIEIRKHSKLITFNFSATLESNISIHTLSGKKVHSNTINGNTYDLNTESFAAGNYLVRIKTKRGITSKYFSIK